MRFFVEECLEESPGNIIPNVIMYSAYNNFSKKIGGAELGERELKKSLLAECKEAGWNNVTNAQKRTSQLPKELRNYMEEILGLKSSRCFFGVAIVKEEAQKEITEFVETSVTVIDNSTEMQKFIQEETGSTNNG